MKNFAHYRPVSNTAFVAKLTERHVASQLINHLVIYGILDEKQSAYCSGYSTETALHGTFNDILMAIDSGKASAPLFLDISAAFDTVDHEIFLTRLSYHC